MKSLEMASQKYKTLSLNYKIKIIELVGLGIQKRKDIAYEFKIPDIYYFKEKGNYFTNEG